MSVLEHLTVRWPLTYKNHPQPDLAPVCGRIREETRAPTVGTLRVNVIITHKAFLVSLNNIRV